MAANYDRLFAPGEGGDIPDEAAEEQDFDIDSSFDTSSPAAPPPMPTGPPRPNGHTPPPTPVDWEDQPTAFPPGTLRPPMPVTYEPPSEASGGRETPDGPPESAEPSFDVRSGFDSDSPVAAALTPTSEPRPNGHTPPPMPVGRTDSPSPPAEPSPAGPKLPPVRPKPPPLEPGPPPPGAQRSRHSRQGRRDPAEPPRRGPSIPPRSHRANAKHNRNDGAPGRTPPRPRPDAPVPSRKGGSAQRPTAPVAAQPHSTSVPVTDQQRGRDAVSHIAVKPAKKSATKAVSQLFWRRWIYKLTRINVGLSRDEKYLVDLHNRIRRSPRGSYQIAILGLKGGAGKTTVTVALGSALALVRRDRVLAFDADTSCGNLADRAGRQSDATVADLLAARHLTQYNDIRAHTSANEVNLEILAAADYGTARRAFSEADWHYAAGAVSKFYNLVLADCGPGLFDPVTRGVLSTASAVVIVTNASIDGARQAAVAIDWLRNNGHQDLLSRACVVINNVFPGETNIAVAELVRQFQKFVQPGRVIVLPWDKHIAAATEIRFSLLEPTFQRRILELAAALSDDFERLERR
jgi:MinD-like ATPase involved in chromosome partitioning or flagellar assembly